MCVLSRLRWTIFKREKSDPIIFNLLLLAPFAARSLLGRSPDALTTMPLIKYLQTFLPNSTYFRLHPDHNCSCRAERDHAPIANIL